MSDHTPTPPDSAISVLVVEPDGTTRAMILSLLRRADIVADDLPSREDVEHATESIDYDVVLLSASEAPDQAELDFSLAERISRSGHPARVIIVTSSLDASVGVEAMRRGAVDLLVKPLVASELVERIYAAAEQADLLRRQSRRIDRLKRVCKRLNEQRAEDQGLAALSAAQNDAHRDVHHDALFDHLSRKIGAMTMADDFGSKIRGELDVEMLLRAVLEHVLHSIGPTNAAIFLPSGEDEWSLGGYINYDVERASAGIILDRLADYVPQQFTQESNLVRLRSTQDIEAVFTDEADWLEHSEVLLAPCRAEDRSLALIMLFRSAEAPFDDSLSDQLELLRELVAEQLSRAVRIHNRAKPGEPWLGFTIGEDEEDESDNADDWGMAA